jgi:hypothetical protein
MQAMFGPSGLASVVVIASLMLAAGSHAAVVRSADANTVLLWHFEETSASSGADVADSGPNHISGNLYNDGVDNTPVTTNLNVAGVSGSGLNLFGLSVTTRALVTGTVGNNWAGGDFTIEFWVKGIKNADLSGADATLGRKLIASHDTQYDWSLGLNSDGGFKLYSNQTTDGDDGIADNSFSHSTGALTWDASKWYYIALVSDADASFGTNKAQYKIYRAADGDASLTLIDTAVLTQADNSPSAGLQVGSDTGSFKTARALDFTVDEVNYSKMARTQSYLNQAVPEPTALGLMSAGILGFLTRRRRR